MDERTELGVFKDLGNLQADTSTLVQDYTDENGWIWSKLSANLPTQIAIQILTMQFEHSQQATPIWKPAQNGVFSTKSAWDIIRSKRCPNKLLNSCWGSRIPTTISIFWWKALHNWIPVDEVLQSRGKVLASKCYCCHKKETSLHVLLHNNEVNKVWKWFSDIFQITLLTHRSIQSRFKSWITSTDHMKYHHIRKLLPVLIGWFSWRARNDPSIEPNPFKLRT